MAADSEAAVHKITELSVVDLKGDLQKTNLNTEGNNSALIEQLQQTKEEERRNPDEISVTPEIPGGMTPERMGKEHTVEDEIEDCGAQDLGEQQSHRDQEDIILETELMNIRLSKFLDFCKYKLWLVLNFITCCVKSVFTFQKFEYDN
ncbi:scaffold attachment factor B1-like [Heterodontus francisci]|uniref:scaffold attachment factor B1-like n=1 Tax=Heterodontus francisci TaxID=7792 RepID=UPI00355AF70F